MLTRLHQVVLASVADPELEQLRKHKTVDSKKTAAIGYCFGGTTVLELARPGLQDPGMEARKAWIPVTVQAITPVQIAVATPNNTNMSYVHVKISASGSSCQCLRSNRR